MNKMILATMRNTIPSRVSEMALTTGKLFTTEEALKVKYNI